MADLSRDLKQVKKASLAIGQASHQSRNAFLHSLGIALGRWTKELLSANTRDLRAVTAGPLQDRLRLDRERIGYIVTALTELRKQADPLGKILEVRQRPNGLTIKKVSVPLGVVAVIYESRPNVTVELAALAIKSGNAIVLKGGRESFQTNKILVSIIHRAMRAAHLPEKAVYLIDPKSEWKQALFVAHDLVDVIVPRGGAGLIEYVRQHARVPVIETGAGVCHTFIDESFDTHSAIEIIVNAKTQRPSVCNSLDTLVVHHKAMPKLFPALAAALASFRVEIRADRKAYGALRKSYPNQLLRLARNEDYGQEFLGLKLAIKTVGSFEEGLAFVTQHTSGHSEAIVTNNNKHARQFQAQVDAAAVYHNASTRFTDGGEFGMGGEVGISTQKLHVRGPMGAEALTSYKWLVYGKGQIRK